MTTLAVDTRRKFVGEVGRDLRVIASDILYQGSALGDNASGYLRPLQAGDPFMGFAVDQCDNSAGAAGDKRVKRYVRGYVELAVTGVTGVGDIRKSVFASDDDTFTLTEGSNSFVGRVIDYISGTTVLVKFDCERAVLGTLAELTGSAVGTANGAMEAQTNTTALTGSTGGTANGAIETLTAITDLTGSTGGTANGALETQTTPADITGSPGGTANGAWEDVSTAVATGGAAADKADVDARLVSIANNFKELETFVDNVRTWVSTVNNNVQELAAKLTEQIALNAKESNNQAEAFTELATQRTYNAAANNNIEEVRARLDDLVRMLE